MTPFLVAAKNGIVELVSEFLDKIPSSIHDTNSRKENVLLVAVKSRQPLIIEILRMKMIKNSKKELWNNLILAMDKEENTILHLAAEALGDGKPGQIAGSALQMMWDIKWFQVHTIITIIFIIIFNILLTCFEVSFLTLIFLKPHAHVGLTYFRLSIDTTFVRLFTRTYENNIYDVSYFHKIFIITYGKMNPI